MKLIKLKPCDNTFFGTGAQFNFGINNVIESKNTPYPSVFFGAIFSAILGINDEFRTKFFKLNQFDHEEILRIGQVYLLNEENNEVYIPAPKDLFINSFGRIKFGTFEKLENKTSLSLQYYLKSPQNKEYKRADNFYINIRNIFDAYKKGQELRIKLISEENIFMKNKKIGIGIDKKKRVVEESKLYRIEQTEFVNNNWNFIVEYDINEQKLNELYSIKDFKDLRYGFLKLGGENKVCRYEIINSDSIDKFNKKRIEYIEGNRFKILFTSDTFFKSNIYEVFDKNDIVILGIANEKPIYIGGVDMKTKDGKTNNPRQMYKGYKAGTVLLVEMKQGVSNTEKIKNLIQDNNVKGFNKSIILEGI